MLKLKNISFMLHLLLYMYIYKKFKYRLQENKDKVE